jgi:hypothetical protein
MKPFSIAAAAGLLIATSALGHAQSSGQRMPDSAPGQKDAGPWLGLRPAGRLRLYARASHARERK